MAISNHHALSEATCISRARRFKSSLGHRGYSVVVANLFKRTPGPGSPGPGVLLLGRRCRASGCPTDPVKRGEPALGRPATAKSPLPDLLPGRGWQGEVLRGDRLQRGWPSVGCARGGTRPSCRWRRKGIVYQAVAWSMRPPPDDMSPSSTPARS